MRHLTLDPRQAREAILAGRAPAGLHVDGTLDLAQLSQPVALPEGLVVRRLLLRGSRELVELPAGLHCYELDASDTMLRELPAGSAIEYRLNLTGCIALERLPDGLTVGSLILQGCSTLTALPEGLSVSFLDISGCSQLQHWPQSGSIYAGHLWARGCSGLRSLPAWIGTIAQLNLAGCRGLRDLPATIQVSSWIDLAGTGITWLPAGARRAQLRWNGVPIDARIAFQPETITGQEILQEPNAERRRVLLERMGYPAFLAQVQASELFRDRDAGGERRLLCVPMEGDEPLVCLSLVCPSTGHQYLLRVPPTMQTCHQAAAWIAGFDQPDAYHPIAES